MKRSPGPNSQEQRVLGRCEIHPKQGGTPDLTGIKSVLELGNKTTPLRMRMIGNPKVQTSVGGLSFRPWYVSRGLTYTSIDWNGLNGALKKDLTQPIEPKSIGGPFDLVTNFGTTEHVSNQLACWENVHNFIKLTGKLASSTPVGPGWETHGFWHPTLEWYQEFADINGYVVERLEEEWFGCRENTRRVTCVRLLKTQDVEFTMPLTSIPSNKE